MFIDIFINNLIQFIKKKNRFFVNNIDITIKTRLMLQPCKCEIIVVHILHKSVGRLLQQNQLLDIELLAIGSGSFFLIFFYQCLHTSGLVIV